VLNSLTNANTGSGNVVFTGGALEFRKNGTTNPSLAFATATTVVQTFSNDFVLADSLAVSQPSSTVSNSTIAGVISGVGGLRKSGNGNIYITGTNNSFGGPVTNSAGTLFVASIGNAGTNSSLGTNGTIQLGDGSGTNALRTINPAAETSDKNFYLGGSSLNSRIENYSGGVLTLNGSINTVTNAGKILYIIAKSNNVVLGGPIATNDTASNNLALSLSNSVGFNLVLSASNAYRGGTTVWNGGLSLSNNSALGTGALTWQTNGSLVALTNLDVTNEIVLGSGTGSAGMALTATANQSLTNKVSGLISGAGGLRLNTASVTAYPANTNNTFTGGFYLQQGTLAVDVIGLPGANSPLGTNGIIYVGTATNANSSAFFKYLGTGETTDKTIWLGGTANTTFSTIDQSGQGLLKFTADVVATNLGPKTLILDGSTTGEGEFAGVISNSSTSTNSLTKRGTGKWTISGTNTYTGPTSVEAGTLQVNGSLPTNSVTVSNGATLSGVGRVRGDLAVSGILDPGTSTNSGPLTVNGALTVSSNGVVNLTIDSLANYDRVSGATSISIDGTISVAASANYVPANGNIFQLFNGPLSGTPTISVTPLTNTNFVWVTNNFTSTGQISVTNIAPSLTAYQAWLTNYPSLSNTNGAADPDGDGFDNNTEFAFDGNPTVGSPSLVTSSNAGSGNVAISYVRRKVSAGGAAYSIQGNPTLTNAWTNYTPATIVTNTNGIALPDSYERNTFEVPANGKNFYRVRAIVE